MKTLLIVISLILSLNSIAQDKKHLDAKFISNSIKIDGILDEADWGIAKIATDFTQSSPIAGEKSSQKTEVKLLYDNEAIYVSAVLFDVSKDSISTTLSNRDDFGNADYFGVMIDTYGKSTVAFAFLVTSAGVQIDDLFSGDGVDRNWNAVWKSHVTVENDRWIVELKIPFSALRFPNQDIQNWNINFNRSVRRNREDTFWNPYIPANGRFMSQFGALNGVKNIKSPLRLSLSPYVSGYLENYKENTATRFSGGMDLKYGLNDAFTLDMTLIPDFGQVKFDEQVLNLSPFEIEYNENRQFFTEGTELFNKGEIFYSRRIGGTPLNRYNTNETDSEQVISNPTSTPLLNATKLSGRTKKGLGIGVFNAITKQTNAIIEDTLSHKNREFITSPLTNYNVVVLDQNLMNNSSVTLTNTSVWRSGRTYDANVTAFGFDVFNKNNSYNLFGDAAVSQLFGTANEFGYEAELSFEKSSGQFQFGVDAELADDKYNPNDFGYLDRNNYQYYTADIQYYTYKPFWKIYKSWTEIEFEYEKLFNPNVYTSSELSAEYGATFKNFTTLGVNINYTFTAYDYFEPRIINRFFSVPKSFNYGYFYSSNYAKRFALDLRIKNSIYETNRNDYFIRISPRIRISDKLSTIYAISIYQSTNEQGLALTNNYNSIIIDNNPVFGERDRQNIENSLEANYIFTNRMGLSFKLRHYWAKVEYTSFYELQNNGSLKPSKHTGLANDNITSIHNNNFNAFTIDMAYKWVFLPGSELSIVWKNSIFSSNYKVDYSYFENTKKLTNLPATNSISLKLLYYLDYSQIR